MKRFFAVTGAAAFVSLCLCSLLVGSVGLAVSLCVACALAAVCAVTGLVLLCTRKESFSVWLTAAVVILVFALIWGAAENRFETETADLSGKTRTYTVVLTDGGSVTKSGSVVYTASSFDGAFDGTVQLYATDGLEADAFDIVEGEIAFFEYDGSSGSYRRAHGTVASGYFKEYAVIGHAPASLRSYVYGLRRSLSSRLNRTVGPGSATVRALLFGDKSGLTEADEDNVRGAGLSHIIAVSGFHVGMISVLLLWLISRIPFRPVRFAVLAVSLFCFMAVCGFTPSVVRAVIMALTGYGLHALGYAADGVNSLGLAVTVLLLFDPMTVCDVGFLLSVTATVGVVALFPVVKRAFRTFLLRRLGVLLPRFVGTVADAIGVSVCCVICSAPVTVFYFGSLNARGIIAYLFCVPLVYLMFFAGIIALAASAVPGGDGIAFLAGRAANAAAEGFMDLAAQFNTAFGSVDPLYALIALAAGFICYLILNAGKKKTDTEKGDRLRPEILIPVFVTVFLIVFSLFIGTLFVTEPVVSDGSYTVTVAYVDVGQGMGSVLYEDGKAVVIDCGGNSKAGDNMVAYMEQSGITEIEFVILSHLHDDHTNAFGDLCDAYEVKEVLIPWTQGDANVYDEVMALCEKEGATVTVLKQDETRTLGDATLRILTAHFLEKVKNQNDNSMVCRADVGAISFLFTGDITAGAEKRMLAAYPTDILSVTVFGVPHHGSGGSSSQKFVDAVRPAYAVFSVGKNNYGHPVPEIIERLRVYAAIYRTDESGTVEFLTNGETLEVKTAR